MAVCLPARHLSQKASPMRLPYTPALCGLGGPPCFGGVIMQSQSAPRGTRGGQSKLRQRVLAEGWPPGRRGCSRATGLAEGQDSKCVSPDVGGCGDVSEEQNSSFFFSVQTIRFPSRHSRGLGKVCASAGTHPTIQEGLKVTRGGHQVGPREAAWETWNEEGGAVVQETGDRPLGGCEGAEGGIVFLGEERGAPPQSQGPGARREPAGQGQSPGTVPGRTRVDAQGVSTRRACGASHPGSLLFSPHSCGLFLEDCWGLHSSSRGNTSSLERTDRLPRGNKRTNCSCTARCPAHGDLSSTTHFPT